MKVERLVAMANDIAAFFAADPDAAAAAEGTASHIRRFWTPDMRRQIVAHLERGGEGLSDVSRAAVQLLARQS